MIYLIFGTQDLMIKKRINKIVKEQVGIIDEFSCMQFNLDEQLIQDLVYEAKLIPFNGEKKVVVGYNASFLLNDKKKIKNDENDFSSLQEYLKYPCETTDLVFAVNGEKLDKKNSLVNQLLKISQVYELVNPNEEQWLQYIDAIMNKKGVKISQNAKSELLKRTGSDAYLIESECEKLSIYSNDITLEDVQMLVSSQLEDNVFIILDSLLKGNKKMALKVYRDLAIKNEEPVRLIGLLASQLRTQIDVFMLYMDGNNESEIADIMKIHPYRVKLALENRRRISLDAIMQEIENLYQLDLAIKSSKVDRFYAFEMFLLNFNRAK